MIAEVASSFIIVAQMVLASGEEVLAYGEQYPTFAMCQREADRQTAEMNFEIRRANQTAQHPVFRNVRMTCYDLTELENSGAVEKGEFDNE